MTGFGKHAFEWRGWRIVAEVKTLNSRQVDVSLRIPSELRPLEQNIRKLAAEYLLRGKIDISLYYEVKQETQVSINDEALRAYVLYFQNLSQQLGFKTDPLMVAIRMPEVFAQPPVQYTDAEIAAFEKEFILCLSSVTDHRKAEGKALESELQKGIRNIQHLLQLVEPYEHERIGLIRSKLQNSLSSLADAANVDQNRFEQELIYYLEKLDITEEKVRLSNHLRYFEETLAGDDYPGRKLNFIAQEIGREINTLGSKANHAHIQKIVVRMKDELEKMKEQIPNIL